MLHVHVFEKPFARGWLLRKLAHAGVEHSTGTGRYWDEHEFVHHRREKAIQLHKWEWAEVDDSRLVWAAAGALHSGKVNASGICESKVLADFNAMKFWAIAAPY